MLLSTAQGDAYAAETEYIDDQEIIDHALLFKSYGMHPTHKGTGGRYTDDTQMALGVSEVLIDGTFTKEAFAEAFVRCFRRDQRPGYARGFQAFLERTQTGAEFLANIRPTSDKNGAAMRSVPLGVLPDVKEVLRVASLQAALTHNTPDGILSSQAVALMSHFALYTDGDFDRDMGAYLDEHLPAFTPYAIEGGKLWPFRVVPPRVGIRTVQAVYCLLQDGNDMLDIMRMTIDAGGDTDSVGAIVWGIASTRMKEPLPEFFETGLERGRKYGVDFLRNLGAELMAKYTI